MQSDPNGAAGPQWQEAIGVAARELPAYVCRQRWYPAKDAALTSLELEALVPLPSNSVRAALTLWRAKAAGRAPFVLFIPLVVGLPAEGNVAANFIVGHLADGRVLLDALASDAFIRSLVELMLKGSASPEGLQAGCTPGIAALPHSGAAPWTVRRSKAEQSNSSVRIADVAMLKVLRRIESGIHPELEIGRFLTEEAHFTGTAALLGWLGLGDRTLALLQAFIPNEGDGWSWIRAHLQAGTESSNEVMQWLATLGQRTAELHAALGTDTADAAFKSEGAEPADWERWAKAIGELSQQVSKALDANRTSLDPQARDLAAKFQGRADSLDQSLAELLTPPLHWQKTRHHGDFHLGQVLVRQHDAIIIDFEGEPLRPLSERRAKHVALRDVAGMLCSIQYAGPSLSRCAPRDQWSAAASRIFLDSYLDRFAQSHAAPLDRQAARRIIRLFQIEKALYEVSYELSNRPAWTAIPLRSLVSLLEDSDSRASTS